MTSIRFLSWTRNAMTCTRGSVAIIFSIAALTLILAGGAALDFSRSFTTRANMQAAADAGVLAATRAAAIDPYSSIGQLKLIAREYFDNNLENGAHLNVTSFTLLASGDGYRVEVRAKMDTTMMSTIGVQQMDLGVSSQAETGPGRPLEIALALDNTGSMSGTKLQALKDSANLLVDKLLVEPADPRARTRVALVPFSNYVNVGLANRNQSWIDVPADYSETKNQCYNTYPNKTGCSTETRTCYNDGVPYDCQVEQCTSNGDPVEVCNDVTSNYVWQGCVGSRNYPLNVQDSDYFTDQVPGLLNVWCSEPITPLTDDKSLIVSKIDEMSASHSTYIPSGLAWAWRVLSSSMPYAEGRTKVEVKDQGGIKALVLMTDGANTKSPNYPYHWSTDVVTANNLTTELCTSIKAEEITVYTIAFEVTDTDIKNLLQSCASETGNYYDATDSTELSKAFEAIAGQLAMLKLTK